jgi:aminopeptidase N
MLEKQLSSDMIGRLLAVRNLNHSHIAKLGQILREDPFHAVRAEAAKMLAKLEEPESRAELIQSSANQKHAHARREVVRALASLHTPESRETLWKMAQTEKNPDILAAIIETWGARPGEAEVSAALKKHLAGTSYQSTLELAAIKALRAHDDESAAPLVLARLQQPHDLRGRDIGTAFDALAFLTRRPTNTNRDAVRDFLGEKLSDPRRDWRIAAAKALGTLRDPKALGLLDLTLAISGGDRIDPVREAAAKAAQDIRASLESPADLKNLWDRVQQLQKKSEDQAKEIEALKKKPQTAKK